MTQATFQLTDASKSQCTLILEELVAHRGEWVPMPHLALISESFNVHTRIDELRSRGHLIDNKCEREKGSRKQHSSYRLN